MHFHHESERVSKEEREIEREGEREREQSLQKIYCVPGSKINFWPHLPTAGELKRKNLTDIDSNIYIICVTCNIIYSCPKMYLSHLKMLDFAI